MKEETITTNNTISINIVIVIVINMQERRGTR